MTIQQIALVIPLKQHSGSLSVWMQKRQSHDELDGMLEFPGGKIGPNELAHQAAQREFAEEVGLQIPSENLELFKLYTYQYPQKQLFFHTFIWRSPDLLLDKLMPEGWFEIVSGWNHDSGLKVPPANIEILKDLQGISIA